MIDIAEISNKRIGNGTLGALIEVVGDAECETLTPLRREYLLSALHELAQRREADQSTGDT